MALADDHVKISVNEASHRWLLESITELLIPEFEKRGFYSVPADEKDARNWRYRKLFPFSQFQRERSDGLEIIQPQLKKCDGVSFVINFKFIQKQNIDSFLRGDPGANNFVYNYRLYQHLFLLRWFSVKRWPWQKLTKFNYEQLIWKVIALLPEIEETLETGICGKHIKAILIK